MSYKLVIRLGDIAVKVCAVGLVQEVRSCSHAAPIPGKCRFLDTAPHIIDYLSQTRYRAGRDRLASVGSNRHRWNGVVNQFRQRSRGPHAGLPRAQPRLAPGGQQADVVDVNAAATPCDILATVYPTTLDKIKNLYAAARPRPIVKPEPNPRPPDFGGIAEAVRYRQSALYRGGGSGISRPAMLRPLASTSNAVSCSWQKLTRLH